jgi:hypothetical protein
MRWRLAAAPPRWGAGKRQQRPCQQQRVVLLERRAAVTNAGQRELDVLALRILHGERESDDAPSVRAAAEQFLGHCAGV